MLCLCKVGSYAQSSPDERRANREKRKTERLARRAERQEKKLKNKVETDQDELVIVVEQEQPTSGADNVLNENHSDESTLKSQDDMHDAVVHKIETTTPNAKSKTESTCLSTPSKNKNIDKTEPAKTPQTSSDDTAFTIFIIIVVAIVAIPIMILKWIFSGRCKKCGKLWAMHTIDEQYLGCSKTKMEKDNQGKLYQVHYNNIKVIQRCKHCGYTTICVEERKG